MTSVERTGKYSITGEPLEAFPEEGHEKRLG